MSDTQKQLPPELDAVEVDEQILAEIESDLPLSLKKAMLSCLTKQIDFQALAIVVIDHINQTRKTSLGLFFDNEIYDLAKELLPHSGNYQAAQQLPRRARGIADDLKNEVMKQIVAGAIQAEVLDKILNTLREIEGDLDENEMFCRDLNQDKAVRLLSQMLRIPISEVAQKLPIFNTGDDYVFVVDDPAMIIEQDEDVLGTSFLSEPFALYVYEKDNEVNWIAEAVFSPTAPPNKARIAWRMQDVDLVDVPTLI
ncbi:hypothetical protein ACFL3T_00350 [Patescibacteria group bacterium]